MFVMWVVFSSMISDVSSTDHGSSRSKNEDTAKQLRAPLCADCTLTRQCDGEAQSTLGRFDIRSGQNLK